MINEEHRVAVVGAAGAVGQELVALLGDRGVAGVICAGRRRRGLGASGRVGLVQQPIGEVDFSGVDVVFLCTPADVSRRLAGDLAKSGCVVVDNSSAFRMSPGVPLVVPEVNGSLLAQTGKISVIANPNCSTILLLVAVAPIDRELGIKRLIVSTYQAVSGAGSAAIEELRGSSAAVLGGGSAVADNFAEPCSFNVFSHDSAVDSESGYNGEELKMESEVAKILGRSIPITATCVRVPVFRSHCESVVVEVNQPATVGEVGAILAAAAGVELVDDREGNRFPTALRATMSKSVLVGRVRGDRSLGVVDYTGVGKPKFSSFSLFLAGDQLLKGAAWNALQIADIAVGRPAFSTSANTVVSTT